MSNLASRRAFLRGRFHDTSTLRPFGAVGEDSFRDACTRCGDCSTACPEGIIIPGDGGYPVVSFNEHACTFCSSCIEACGTGSLTSSNPWTWRPDASNSCLSANSVYCRTCQDHCDETAIRFQLRPGGRSPPEFDSDLCTGCGACAASCPVNAIEFSQASPTTEAKSC